MDITVSDEVSQEYHELVKNILCNREFLKLSLYTHHQWTTRLMHSINVSYLSWFIARKLGCDEKAAARAGLLHDFCPYDFRAETPTGEHQAFYHPKAAADNSAAHFDVTDRELDAILSHMFPLGPLPRNKEAWIISFADKACAVFLAEPAADFGAVAVTSVTFYRQFRRSMRALGAGAPLRQ